MGGSSLRRSPRRLGRTGTVQTPSPAQSYAPGGQRNVSRGSRTYRAAGKPPISAPAPPLQADPEEPPHPRGQIEGGNVAGRVEEFQAEEGHDVADDDHDQQGL